LYDCADGIDRDGDLDLADGELDAYRDKKSAKELNQLEVAIGDGMEFTIHGKRIENNKTTYNFSSIIIVIKIIIIRIVQYFYSLAKVLHNYILII